MVAVTLTILAKIPILYQLGHAACQQLLDHSSMFELETGDIIYQSGDNLGGLYAVVSGHVKLYREAGERLQILALLREGDCFGIEALSDLPQSSYTASSLGQSQLLFLPKDFAKQLMVDLPQARFAMLQLMTGRLRQFADLVHNLAFRDVTARLATIILMRAQEEGIESDEGIHVPRLMTQSELATMVGTGREVVLRTFKKLEKQHIIRVSRKEILILNIDQLRTIAEEENR